MAWKGKILALDYGKGSIGLAITDESQEFVFGRGALVSKKGDEDVLKKIHALCEQEKIIEVVIGLPLGVEGEETPQTARIRRFGLKLKAVLPSECLISFQDESFSSFEAGKLLMLRGIQPKNRKQAEDEMAAILILERFLASQKRI